MLNSTLQVVYIFLKSLFYYMFKIVNSNRPLYFSIKCLIENVSYSLKQECSKDIFLTVRVLKRAIADIIRNQHVVQKYVENHIALYDNCFLEIDFTIPYIEKMEGKKIGLFIDKSKILSISGVLNKFILVLVSLFVFSIVLLPASLSVKRRINLSLLIAEIPGCISLLYFVRMHQVKELHFLSIPEIDSNFTAYMLMKNNVYVNKITAANALAFNNEIIITNTLSLSCRYQVDEVEHYKNTMFYNKIQNWIPFSALSYIDKYLNMQSTSQAYNRIGFYSSGGFIRHYIGDNNSEELLHNENILLGYLADLLSFRNDIQLIIFLHPLEKRNNNFLSASQEYYEKIFSGLTISYAPKELSTTSTFDLVEIAISTYSTVSFERLFCGFKSLFFNVNMKNFPIENSRLQNICSNTKSGLLDLITANLEISPTAFFDNNKINDYHFKDPEYFKLLN